MKRSVTDTYEIPVIFNKLEDRALIRDRVVHVVLLRKRRDDQQWQPGTVTCSPLITGERRIGPRRTWASRPLLLSLRMVHQRRHNVIVPTIGIVIRDNDRRVAPVR